MKIRPYRNSDLNAIVTCFNRSVRQLGARYYTPEQIAAWAPDPTDLQAWSFRLESGGVFVAEIGTALAGFVRVEAEGLVDLLYVDPGYVRRGAGRELLQTACSWATQKGADRLWAEVSLAARPLFETMGFLVEAEQTVERRGVHFQNFRMTRPINAGHS